jgi:hypothetical protein
MLEPSPKDGNRRDHDYRSDGGEGDCDDHDNPEIADDIETREMEGRKAKVCRRPGE